MLVASSRDTFGCTTDGCTCVKHLRVPGLEEEPDPDYLPRIRFLFELESMRAVGCRFAPDDLSPDAWHDLIELARARSWVDRKVDDLREDIREREDKEREGVAEMRAATGIAPPGHSLFSTRK